MGGPPPVDTAELSGTSATSRTSAWIVGSVAWRWDGSAWRTVGLPSHVSLSAVAAVSPNDVWAVGEASWRLHIPNEDGSRTSARIEHWDGAQWTTVPFPHRSWTIFNGISASGPHNVWAIGAMRTVPRHGNWTWHPLLLHFDGHGWSRQPVPWARRPLELTDGGTIVADGVSGVWLVSNRIEYWNGARWRAVPPPFGARDGVSDFGATGWNDAWAVGSYRIGAKLPANSHPLAAHWNGSAWTVTPVPGIRGDNDAELDSVAVVGRNDVWASGPSDHVEFSGVQITGETEARALVVHWDGRRWSVTAASGFAGYSFPSVAAAPDGSAWVVGACSNAGNIVLGWNGSSWSVARHPSDVTWDPITPVSDRTTALPSCGSG